MDLCLKSILLHTLTIMTCIWDPLNYLYKQFKEKNSENKM